jgi:tetratricopeptide (TPR) repeat protein
MRTIRIRHRHPGYAYFCLAALMFLSLLNCTAMYETKQQREGRHYLTLAQKLLARGDYEGALAENQELLALSNRQPPADAALFNMGLIYAHFANPKRDYKKSLDFFVELLNEYPGSPFIEEAKTWVGVLHDTETLTHSLEESKQTLLKTRERVETLEKAKKAEPVILDREEARGPFPRHQGLLARGDYEGALAENQKVLALSNRQPPGDEALFNIGLIYAHSGNPKKDYRKALDSFRKVIADYPKSPFVEQAKIWAGILQENERLNRVIENSREVDMEIEERKRGKLK